MRSCRLPRWDAGFGLSPNSLRPSHQDGVTCFVYVQANQHGGAVTEEPPLPLSHAGMQQGHREGGEEGSQHTPEQAPLPPVHGVEVPPASAPAASTPEAQEDVAALQQRISVLEKELLDSENTHLLRHAGPPCIKCKRYHCLVAAKC